MSTRVSLAALAPEGKSRAHKLTQFKPKFSQSDPDISSWTQALNVVVHKSQTQVAPPKKIEWQNSSSALAAESVRSGRSQSMVQEVREVSVDAQVAPKPKSLRKRVTTGRSKSSIAPYATKSRSLMGKFFDGLSPGKASTGRSRTEIFRRNPLQSLRAFPDISRRDVQRKENVLAIYAARYYLRSEIRNYFSVYQENAQAIFKVYCAIIDKQRRTSLLDAAIDVVADFSKKLGKKEVTSAKPSLLTEKCVHVAKAVLREIALQREPELLSHTNGRRALERLRMLERILAADEKFTKRAGTLVAEGGFPENETLVEIPITDREFAPVLYRAQTEVLMHKMAHLCLTEGRVEKLNGSSGDVYLLSNGKDVPLFVFKVCKDEEIDDAFNFTNPQGAWYPFADSKGYLREYATWVLGLQPAKSLCCLDVGGDGEQLFGVLCRYIPHICTLDDRIVSEKLDEEPEDEQLQSVYDLLQEENGGYRVAHYKIWDHITPESVHRLIAQDLRLPNFDRNINNAFVCAGGSEGREYHLVGIDADQTLPMRWGTINPPIWYGGAFGDAIIKDLPVLKQCIKGLDAHADFLKLKKAGIHIEGLALDIAHAFHVAAKVALESGSTINKLGQLLFEGRNASNSALQELYESLREEYALDRDPTHSLLDLDPPRGAVAAFWSAFEQRIKDMLR